MSSEPTIAERARLTLHRSLFREKWQRVAGDRPLTDWLVEEANLRGHFGAMAAQLPSRAADHTLSDEQLIALLLMPHAMLDVRVFKLVVRMVQGGKLDAQRLWFEAKKERADSVLYWLLLQVPREEAMAEVGATLNAHPAPPRGYRPLPIDYDARRLLRRPATKESLWKAARRSF